MSTFVLLAGAWHGAWCWKRVRPLLIVAGHQVLTPDLLGTGDDATPLTDLTLARWVDQIATLVDDERDPVVLVGHSRSGIIISEVAERIPERVASLVYVAGSLIPDGSSIADVRKPSPDEASMLLIGEDGGAMFPAELVGPIFLNESAAEWVEFAVSKFRPEPMWVHATPLTLTQARFGRVPRAYIETSRDHGVPLDLQRSMQAMLPCDPVFTLETDHSPFFSDPEGLARCLLAIAERCASTTR